MITHYWKLAWRNILKDKIYSFINLIGLSIAITSCFLVIFWAKYEFSFEDCHLKVDRIYKVLVDREKMNNVASDPEQVRPSIFRQLKETFPEIKASTFVNHSQATFIYEDKGEAITVDYVNTTPDYLEIFSYEFIEGNKENIKNENGVIISQELAYKIFGEENAVGKTISLMRRPVLTVNAVVKMPKNTNLKFDILDLSAERGLSVGVHYILIGEKTRISKETQQRMRDFLSTISETEDKLIYQPLKDAYFHTPKKLAVPKELAGNTNDWKVYGDLKKIYLFLFTALLILAIAIINYVNTSTARALSRMREVGIRKVVGSNRRQLVFRFLEETLIISAASIVIALAATKFLFPAFSIMMESKATFLFNFDTILIIFALCLIITIFSGGYAAFYLSSIDPVTVIQGGVQPSSKENFRKILIGFQFFLSIGMLISTFMIYKQIYYIFTANTGVNSKNIIVIETLSRNAEDFIQTIKENPHIIEVTHASRAPYDIQNNMSDVSWEGMKETGNAIKFSQIYCDHSYAATFGLQVIRGEFIQSDWNRNVDLKSCDLIINETFQKLMGEDDPLGITVNFGFVLSGKIVGVVKDFNFRPLKEPITPLIIAFMPSSFRNIYVKTSGINNKETTDYILKKYKELKVSPTEPLLYYTAEDDYNTMYKTELQIKKMLIYFSIISLCLCIMGIIGMVTLMIEKRKKEIAIRIINGAIIGNIILLFINYFIKIIGVACLFVIPVSYIILLRWIQTYAFSTSLSWWIFVLIPVVVALITAILITIQLFLSIRRNPAEVIKKE